MIQNITQSFIQLTSVQGLPFLILPEDIRGLNVQRAKVQTSTKLVEQASQNGSAATMVEEPVYEEVEITVVILPYGQNAGVQEAPERIIAAIQKVNLLNQQELRKAMMMQAPPVGLNFGK